MLRKHLENKNGNEYGFTLIELLVVILIIGILAAIAIPAFLNQRQRANDAALESDIRNLATQVESALIEVPNATHFFGATDHRAIIGEDGQPVMENGRPVMKNHSGANVYFSVSNERLEFEQPDPENFDYSMATSDENIIIVLGSDYGGNYLISGYHMNGKKYNLNNGGMAIYSSRLGGFVTLEEYSQGAN